MNKSVDDIYNLFTGEDVNTVEHDKKIIKTFIEIINTKNVFFLPFDQEKCRLVIGSMKKTIQYYSKKSKDDVPHDDIPFPDPIEGRPHLKWRVCKFKNCGKQFSSGIKLVEHLIECNAFTKGYHFAHEMVIRDERFTSEYILKNNIKRCTSYICGKQFDSPEELIKHLQRLGMEPFWQPGMTFDDEQDKEKINYRKIFEMDYKCYSTEKCVICLDNAPVIISVNCRHNVWCQQCYQDYSEKMNMICPTCRSKISLVLPFA